MDFFMGLKGKDFIVVCSDTVAAQSIIRMKADEEKMFPIDEHKLFVMSGHYFLSTCTTGYHVCFSCFQYSL